MTLSHLANQLTRNDVVFMHDAVSNSRWWMLRSLPALNDLGITHYTFPTSWRQITQGGTQYDYLDYEYHVIGNMSLPPSADLCVITNDHYEHETAYSIEHLINRFTAQEGTLIVVADSSNFQPGGGQRPLAQEQFTDRIGSVNQLYQKFEEHYQNHGWSLPLIDTKNVFIQDNANLYEFVTGDSLSRTEELFEVLPDAPYLPLYDVFSDIFARSETYGSLPLDKEEDVAGLGRWLRRRIEWDRGTGVSVARELNRTVSEDGKTFDPSYARRSPAVFDAQSKAEQLHVEENPIAADYHEVLTVVAS